MERGHLARKARFIRASCFKINETLDRCAIFAGKMPALPGFVLLVTRRI